MAKSPNGEAAKDGPPPYPSPTMRDAIREGLSPEELRDFISERLGATIRRELKALGFPFLPVAKLNIQG